MPLYRLVDAFSLIKARFSLFAYPEEDPPSQALKISKVALEALCVIAALFFMPYPAVFILGTFIGYVASDDMEKALSELYRVYNALPITLSIPITAISLVFYNTIIAGCTFYLGGHLAVRTKKLIAHQ